MISPHQATVTRTELAAELRIHPGHVSRLARQRPEFRAARIMRGIYSVQRLRDAGLLPRAASEAQS